MEVVYETLHELGADDKKIVTLFNKQDKTDGSVRLHDHRADYVLSVSAKEGTGLEDLRKVLEKIILEEQIFVERVFPYTEAGKLALIRQNGTLMEEEYREDGIAVKAYVPRDIYGKI
jgi:GTP-binding protein HflX